MLPNDRHVLQPRHQSSSIDDLDLDVGLTRHVLRALRKHGSESGIGRPRIPRKKRRDVATRRKNGGDALPSTLGTTSINPSNLRRESPGTPEEAAPIVRG